MLGNITKLANFFVYPREDINTTLYFYQTREQSLIASYSMYIGRIALQEAFETMMFTFVFLVLTYEPSFAKTSRTLKGIVLLHVLYMCYVFCLRSGASLNPALGFAQTIYWVAIAAADKY